MKFREYIKELQKFLRENPEAGEFDTVYAVDEEGNSFKKVDFTPTLGNFEVHIYPGGKEANFGEFCSLDTIDNESDYPINAVCIN